MSEHGQMTVEHVEALLANWLERAEDSAERERREAEVPAMRAMLHAQWALGAD